MDDPDSTASSLLTRLTLDLRGQRFSIERETLMNLPESVLLCLFPNGLVLSRQNQQQQYDAQSDDEEDDEEVYLVDFDPTCLTYVLRFFKSAQDLFYGSTSPSRRSLLAASHPNAAGQLGGDLDAFGTGGAGGGNPLLSKQAIIVLREELEYFAIPPKATSQQALVPLKAACGEALIGRRSIFTALQRNVSKENNMAEQHLIDMLCMSGFDREDTWGFRALEPNRCCITSIALVLLKTGISVSGEGDTPASASEEGELVVDHAQLATAQKLLLFWRKPARKCWWDGVDVVVPFDKANTPAPASDDKAASADADPTAGGMTQAESELLASGKGQRVRVWARRVWTLELSLI